MPASAPPQAPFKTKNKLKRHDAYLKHKKAKESARRDERFRRKREEDRNPRLRVERRARNVPATIDRKRVWDDVDGDEGDGIGLSVDVASLKRRKVDDSQEESNSASALTESNLKQVEAQTENLENTQPDEEANNLSDSFFDDNEESDDEEQPDFKDAKENVDEENSDDLASLLNSSDSDDNNDQDSDPDKLSKTKPKTTGAARDSHRPTSPPASATSTNLSLIPDALAAKFPTLFNTPTQPPKLLITTSQNSTLHAQATVLTTLFPNSTYIPRTRHKHNSHAFSVRQIAGFAAKRGYTGVLVLEETRKRPAGLTAIHLPAGPTFHFSITNWVEGRKLPGHGNPTGHAPELILNNFRTPLGVLTASLFRRLFPPAPEAEGRQVVTLHNQRDYIFVRRHRYVFRDRRPTEKVLAGALDDEGAGQSGKSVRGKNSADEALQDIRAGLQELGPRFTLKLRRVDRGIQRASGQEWEWKSRMEKVRTKFQL